MGTVHQLWAAQSNPASWGLLNLVVRSRQAKVVLLLFAVKRARLLASGRELRRTVRAQAAVCRLRIGELGGATVRGLRSRCTLGRHLRTPLLPTRTPAMALALCQTWPALPALSFPVGLAAVDRHPRPLAGCLAASELPRFCDQPAASMPPPKVPTRIPSRPVLSSGPAPFPPLP